MTGLARMPDLGSNTTLFHFGPVFSPDSKTLAYASDEGMVRLWDVTAARQTATLPMYGSAILTLAFAPDGKTLAAATADKTIVFWDLARNRELTRVGRKEAIVSLSFTVSGKLLASSTRKGVVKVLPIACPKRADQ